jgi:hypothetical protein
MNAIPPNPYLVRVGFYLTRDRPNRAKEFKDAAKWWKEEAENVVLHELDMAPDFFDVADSLDDGSVGQLAVFAHGTSKALGRPGRFGLDMRAVRRRPPHVYSEMDFAELWAPKLVDGALISLGACLCSRDPKWYRVQLWGRDLSSWSAKSYERGGSMSFAARLAQAFKAYSRRVKVRGHCAAGHTIHQALLREHTGEAPKGRPLFGIVHGMGIVPERPLRRQWQREVKGELAARWLLGINDGETVRVIKERLGL